MVMDYQMPKVAVIQCHSIPSAAMAPVCVDVPTLLL